MVKNFSNADYRSPMCEVLTIESEGALCDISSGGGSTQQIDDLEDIFG